MKRLKMNTILSIILSAFLVGAGCSEEDKTVAPPPPVVAPDNPDNVMVVVTSRSDVSNQTNVGLRVIEDAVLAGNEENISTLRIDIDQTYQEMDGFGYTLTGGSAQHLMGMSASNRKALLEELFGTDAEKGQLGISFLRLSIAASDLDAKAFSYALVKGEDDDLLKNFSISEDQKNLIPVLKEIVAIQPNIKFLSTPWSPPTWMKTNNSAIGGQLLETYYEAYADYFIKYIEAYKREGINIYAITVQNEPLHPGNEPSMLMHADEMSNFIAQQLGPKFRAGNIDTKIITYDHNADRPDYPIDIIKSAANEFISGSAFHLYGGDISALSQVKAADVTKDIYFTEQWVDSEDADFGGTLMWHFENIIIGATRNWAKGVMEWNLTSNSALTPRTPGGCTRCLGGLTVDDNEVNRNVAYYIIGHASKYIPVGSVRIKTNQMGNLPNVAFLTPEGKTVTLIMNNSESNTKLNLNFSGTDEKYTVSLPSNSVATIIHRKPVS
ncbi:glucosylceramidase [Flammeovirga sp. MY04]|nr:glucosylceramidase [Flammeovirga sp. MY04]